MKKLFIKKQMSLSLIILLLLSVFTSCTVNQNIEQIDEESTYDSDVSQHIITDMANDTVELPEKIENVASTSNPCTDMMIALGAGCYGTGAI